MTGAKLRALRLAAGLTQGQLADRMGCSRALVARQETGVDPIGMERTYAIAAALGLVPATLDPRLTRDVEVRASPSEPVAPRRAVPTVAPAIRAALLRDEPTKPGLTVEADDYSQGWADD